MRQPASIKQWFSQHVLDANTTEYPRWKWWPIFVLRLLYAMFRDLTGGRLSLQATSLVYTTLLSIVPLLAVSFSVLKAFGVHNQLQPALNRFLAPLGPQGTEVTQRIINFVENIQVGVLGTMGLAFLLYTAVALIQKIEYAFNETWQIRRARTPTQLFSEYLSVLLVGPVLIFTALGITAAVFHSGTVQRLESIQPFGFMIWLITTTLPTVLIIAAFAFIYSFVPNTRVRTSSALVGGLVAGILWQATGLIFTTVIATSSHYTAIYSAFASLVLFMIWLYLSWLILLVGAHITYYHQYPRNLLWLRHRPQLSLRMFEWTALSVLVLIAQHYYQRRTPWSAGMLANRLRLPQNLLNEVLDALTGCGLLEPMESQEVNYLPAVPLDTTTVHDALVVLRRHGEQSGPGPERLRASESVQQLMPQIEAAFSERIGDLSIRDLALAGMPGSGKQGSAEPVSAPSITPEQKQHPESRQSGR